MSARLFLLLRLFFLLLLAAPACALAKTQPFQQLLSALVKAGPNKILYAELHEEPYNEFVFQHIVRAGVAARGQIRVWLEDNGVSQRWPGYFAAHQADSFGLYRYLAFRIYLSRMIFRDDLAYRVAQYLDGDNYWSQGYQDRSLIFAPLDYMTPGRMDLGRFLNDMTFGIVKTGAVHADARYLAPGVIKVGWAPPNMTLPYYTHLAEKQQRDMLDGFARADGRALMVMENSHLVARFLDFYEPNGMSRAALEESAFEIIHGYYRDQGYAVAQMEVAPFAPGFFNSLLCAELAPVNVTIVAPGKLRAVMEKIRRKYPTAGIVLK